MTLNSKDRDAVVANIDDAAVAVAAHFGEMPAATQAAMVRWGSAMAGVRRTLTMDRRREFLTEGNGVNGEL